MRRHRSIGCFIRIIVIVKTLRLLEEIAGTYVSDSGEEVSIEKLETERKIIGTTRHDCGYEMIIRNSQGEKSSEDFFLGKKTYKEEIRIGFPADRMKERMIAFGQKIRFTEDNFVETMLPIPDDASQEEIDKIVASGDAKVVDGMMIMSASDPVDAIQWKEENGQFFTMAEFNFETNEFDSSEINVVDDNTLDYMMFRIVRE